MEQVVLTFGSGRSSSMAARWSTPEMSFSPWFGYLYKHDQFLKQTSVDYLVHLHTSSTFSTMAFKIIVFAAVVAIANAGNVAIAPAPLAAAIHAAPAIAR